MCHVSYPWDSQLYCSWWKLKFFPLHQGQTSESSLFLGFSVLIFLVLIGLLVEPELNPAWRPWLLISPVWFVFFALMGLTGPCGGPVLARRPSVCLPRPTGFNLACGPCCVSTPLLYLTQAASCARQHKESPPAKSGGVTKPVNLIVVALFPLRSPQHSEGDYIPRLLTHPPPLRGVGQVRASVRRWGPVSKDGRWWCCQSVLMKPSGDGFTGCVARW